MTPEHLEMLKCIAELLGDILIILRRDFAILAILIVGSIAYTQIALAIIRDKMKDLE